MKRVSINAILREIDWFFSEHIKQDDISDKDTLMGGSECLDGINYVYRKIDRRDISNLFKVAQKRLKFFLKAHPDNSLELFIKKEIENAKEWQTYFPKWETDNKEKEIYFDLEGYITFLSSDFVAPHNTTIKYFVGDQKKSGTQVNHYEYLKVSGMLDEFNKNGFVINPTHNFELLKEIRKNLFDKAEKEFISERHFNGVKITSFELNHFYIMWLNGELKVIDKWLSDKKESNSNQLEIMKYSTYVNDEIIKTEISITSQQNSTHLKVKLDNVNIEIETQKLAADSKLISTQIDNKAKLTLRELALYYYYLGCEVNKENQNELLKNYKQNSGAKLKQNYDYFHKTINRINVDTERKNSHRIKEFEHVIDMLKAIDNKQAIQKAVDEYTTFKTKLE